MKKKWTIISVIVGLLVMSIGVYVAVAKNKPLAIDPDLKLEIASSKHYLGHMFYKNDPSSELQMFHENDKKEFKISIWHNLKGDYDLDINECIEDIVSKVENKKVRADLIRAEELWHYARQHEDEIALGYAYMIYHDLDKLINNNTDSQDFAGVTEYQGVKGKKYEEMIVFYDNYVKKFHFK